MATSIVAVRTLVGGGGTLALDNLSSPNGVIPANPATVDLTLYNTATDIQVDPQLRTYTDAGWVTFIVDGDALDATASANLLRKASTNWIPRRFTVSATGDVDYNTIKEAVDAAIAAGASVNSPYLILVYPGDYVEDKITVTDGIHITSPTGQDHRLVFVSPSVPTDDLFVLSGGLLSGLDLYGVTDASKALIRCSSGITSVVFQCQFLDAPVAVRISGAGVECHLSECQIVPVGVGEGVGIGFHVSGGAKATLQGINVVVTSTVAALYAPLNVIHHVLHVEGVGTVASLLSSRFVVVSNDGMGRCVHADDGAEVYVSACVLKNNDTGLYIGADGVGTNIHAQATVVSGNTLNFESASATGTFIIEASGDALSKSLVAGATIAGLFFAVGTNRSLLVGPTSHLYTPSDRIVDIKQYMHTFGGNGAIEAGGIVTDGGGLSVDVTGGDGFIFRSIDEDLESVEWGAGSVVLAPSATNYVIYDGTAAALSSIIVAPGDTSILFAIVVTDGVGVRFIHEARAQIEYSDTKLQEYLLATRKFVLNSGLGVTAGTTVRNLDVDLGSYYQGLKLVSYGGGADVTFSAFYGANGVSEVAAQTLLNITQYDNAGVLAAMTGGFYRTDSVVLTSDGRVSVIFGTAETAIQATAAAYAFAAIPTFIEPSGCTLAKVVVQQGVGIVEVVDARPVASDVGGGGGGISAHGLLSGLAADDHTQYLLATGARALSGNLNMGGQEIQNVGNVDGVDVSAHAARHNPGGVDALATDVPVGVSIGAAPDAGAAGSLAKSDHQHGDLVVAGQAQGDILYRGAAAWTRLGAGTAGQHLMSGGVAANPSWSSTSVGLTSLGIRSTGTGAFDLTLANTENLTAGRTLTFTLNNVNRTINLGGNLTLASGFTTVGAFSTTLTSTGITNVTLPTSGTLLSSASAAGGDLGGTYPNPTVTGLTITGEVQGSLLYFDGANWVQLAPGASGQFLKTQGAGANPTWSVLSGSSTLQTAYDNGPTITTAGAVPVTLNLASGGFTVTGSGTVNVGADATVQALNIGTGAAAKTVALGSSSGASTTNINAGTGNTNVTSAFALNGIISPASLAVSQNNYNPAGLAGATVIRQDASTDVDITGLQGGVAGRVVTFNNVSALNKITLKNASLSSDPANRFEFGSDLILAPNISLIMQYDGVSSRWRALSNSGAQLLAQVRSRFFQSAANAATARGDHNTISVGANADIYLEFSVPDDFLTLVSVYAIMIPGATNAAANIDLASDYAGIGEVYNFHSESNTASTYPLTINVMTALDLSSVFSTLSAGDLCGVHITHNTIGATAYYLGIKLSYL